MKIFQILLKALKWGAVSVLGLVVFVFVIVFLFGRFDAPIPEQNNVVVALDNKVETKVATQQLPEYLTQKDFNFLCSTKTDDGHEVDYFESNTKNLGTHLVFRQGITDVGISISKVTSVGG